MAEWKVLLTDGLKETGKDLFENRAELDDRNGISAEELLTVIGEFDGVIVRGRTKMTREVIQRADKLKVIGRAGVGVDNIDLAAAQSASITVVNSPIASTQAVAEYTIALMLSVLRNIPRADHDMKSGFWNKKKLAGQELSGKTLGIIGLGRIGSSVAQLAGAFGMELIGHDPFLTYEDIQDKRVRPVDIGEVYAQADLITIHVPLSPKTRGMISGQEIGYMKPGVFLICTARGGLIDETAVLAGLESGQIAGAGLDVYAEEPPGLTALVAHPKVVATPHIGAQTLQAQERAAVDIASEVMACLEGKPLRWKVV